MRFYYQAMQLSPVSIDPNVMGGTPVFRGTRVPVRLLIDYLESGDSIEYFLEGFPSVGRDQVFAFLDLMSEKVAEIAH